MSAPIRLSHSALDTLAKCGVMFEYAYIKRMRRPPGVALLVGRGVDESVNRNMESRIVAGEPISRAEAAETAFEAVGRAVEREGVQLTDEEAGGGVAAALGFAKDRAVSGAVLHHAELAPLVQPQHIQRKMEFEIAGENAQLVVRTDIEESEAGQARVRDVKTSKRSPNGNAAEVSEQLTLYAMARGALDGTPGRPLPVALDFVVQTPSGQTKVKTLHSERGPDDYDRMLRRIEAALRVVRTGAFYPARPDDWWCSQSFCGYFGICPYARRPTAVVVGQKKNGTAPEDGPAREEPAVTSRRPEGA